MYSPDDFRTDQAELRRVMAEAHRIGAENPALAAPLLAELQASDPNLWPLVVESYRSRLAYGEQLREKESMLAREPHRRSHGETGESSETIVESTPPPDSSLPWTEPRVARLPTADSTLLIRMPGRTDDDGSFGTAFGSASNSSPWTHFEVGTGSADTDSTSSPASVPVQSTPAPPPSDPNRLDSGIIRTSHESPIGDTMNVATGDDWQTLLDEAIRRLDARLDGSLPDDPSAITERARLELLRIVAGRSDAASTSASESDPWTSRFWAGETALLRTLLECGDAELSPDQLREAYRHLRVAAESLAEAAPLEVRNPAFCKAIDGFGSVKRFDSYVFQPNQRVLLYAEVENFGAEQTPRGYHTSLRSRYAILNRLGKQVGGQEAIPTEEFCANQRRDFFLGCDFRMPREIHPGEYTLILWVEDMKTGKTAETRIDFAIE